tara:strand:+ start:207 stop:971 length:765 start_codon:yes stop_codon:yes gene_type:complete
MAGIRDLESGKIYIGVEEPVKLDQAAETLNGDKPFDGTLVATGPTFLGAHKGGFAKATLNVGTALGDWSPGVDGRAVQVEGDVEIIGEKAENAVVVDGNSHVTGNISTGGDLSVGGFASWSGSIVATTKLFDISHPNKEGHRLAHACLEGPELAIYHRGRLKSGTEITLPDYWKNMVYEDSITVQITPIGKQEDIYVLSFNSEKVVLESDSDIDCFYIIMGERNDVNPLTVEYEGKTWKDYPKHDSGQNTKTVI